MPESSRVTKPRGIFGTLANPLALGTLRLTTEGRPADVDAMALLHFALNQGIRILDTADVYCRDERDLHYGENLIRQAVASWNGPADEVRVITKVGLRRAGTRWLPNGRPEHLREAVDGCLKALGVECLFLLQLHATDPQTPLADSLGTLAELQQAGKVAHLGLCNVAPDEFRLAQRHFPVTCVQNELSLFQRKSIDNGLLDLTGREEIPFLAYRPLGGHRKAAKLDRNPFLTPLAERHGATAAEICLAAVGGAGRHVIPLVGATRLKSVKSCLRAREIELDVSDRTAISLGFSFRFDDDNVSSPDGSASPADDLSHASVVSPQTSDSSLASRLACGASPSESPEVVILMGIQGAGKSEFVGQYVASGYARLNRDELGGRLDDLVPRMVELLQHGQTRVVLDNTYPNRASRAPVIAAAHRCGIPVRCRHLATSLADAHVNIAQRMIARYGMPLGPAEMKMFGKADPNLPPPQALARWLATFEPPTLDEGFSAIDEIDFVRRVDRAKTAKGVLLDVDGTVRRTLSGEYYPRHPDDLEILPGRREVLSEWSASGHHLFLVSNQSGVSSGRVNHETVQACLFRTAELLGLPIAETVYCPHPSRPVGCYCRKPMPGLGVYLIERHQLDREQLVMVGDMNSDAEFAAGLGIRFEWADDFFR